MAAPDEDTHETGLDAPARRPQRLPRKLPKKHQRAASWVKSNNTARIVLKATGAVLIRIEDSRGNVVVSHTLAAGDRYQVPSREDLVVVAGDGGLVNVEIDGVRRGTLGMPGEIVVGRPLKVSALLAGQG